MKKIAAMTRRMYRSVHVLDIAKWRQGNPEYFGETFDFIGFNHQGRCKSYTDANDEFHGAIVENRTNLLTGNYASLVLSGNYEFDNITKNGKVRGIHQKFVG